MWSTVKRCRPLSIQRTPLTHSCALDASITWGPEPEAGVLTTCSRSAHSFPLLFLFQYPPLSCPLQTRCRKVSWLYLLDYYYHHFLHFHSIPAVHSTYSFSLLFFLDLQFPGQDDPFGGGAAPLRWKPFRGSKLRGLRVNPTSNTSEAICPTETSAPQGATGGGAETQGKEPVRWVRCRHLGVVEGISSRSVLQPKTNRHQSHHLCL